MLRLPSMVLAGIVLTAGVSLAQPVVDQEKIVDVGALREVMRSATSPIAQRIANTKLEEKFERVSSVLSRPQVDKQELVSALKDLQGEMDRFTLDWEGTVSAPMWNAQESVGATVDRIRKMLARNDTGAPTERTRRMLETYDTRLTQLARSIQSETDESRKARLRLVFANVRSLREIVARTGGVNLGSAREQVYVKLVHALTALEAQLTNATFETERLRIVMANESEFIGAYVGVLEGLVEAESLARMLAALNADGSQIGDMSSTIDGLSDRLNILALEMDGFVEQLADSIEIETSQIGDDLRTRIGSDKALDAEIERYARGNTEKEQSR